MTIDNRIDELLSQPKLAELVDAYYAADLLGDDVTFAGTLFDTHGDNPTNSFTQDDLFALNFLDAPVAARATRRLLHHRIANDALSKVPDHITLWDATNTDLDHAQGLWRTLVDLPGIGTTRASKLCARKRSKLIPIRDSVIVRVLALPDRGSWVALRDASQPHRDRIAALNPKVPNHTPSELRLLDVAAWMIGSGSKSARTARTEVGLPSDPPM